MHTKHHLQVKTNPIKGSVSDELLCIGQLDWLECQACKEIIWYWPLGKESVWPSDIQRAYYKHAKKCTGLKRAIVLSRR